MEYHDGAAIISVIDPVDPIELGVVSTGFSDQAFGAVHAGTYCVFISMQFGMMAIFLMTLSVLMLSNGCAKKTQGDNAGNRSSAISVLIFGPSPVERQCCRTARLLQQWMRQFFSSNFLQFCNVDGIDYVRMQPPNQQPDSSL